MAPKLKINLSDRLKRIPRNVQYGLAIGIPLVIIVLFFFFDYRPKKEEIGRLRKEVAKQEKNIAKAETMLRKLPVIKAEYEKKMAEFEELKRALPEEKEISTLLKQVSDLGIKSGLTIRLWKPQKRRIHSSGIVYEIPVKVEMSGSYHRLGVFFSELTRLDRIVNIRNVSLGNARPAGKEAILRISFNAVTFSSIPEEELAKRAGKGKRRKRR
ncbi:MAG TPA: hypothetical protein ENK09_04080 [Nitrospirae bacterium]|nr:hypothetical protein [Nitrospirota bacterium]